MDPVMVALLAAAAVLAGMINAAVGSGSLLTLPVLMALGLPPGVAVRTNTVGMVFATFGSVAGYRREILSELRDLRGLGLATLIGAISGSLLLLVSSPGALDIIVPILICLALVIVVGQPRLTRHLKARAERRVAAGAVPPDDAGEVSPYRRPGLIMPMGAAAVYGGYFTAAQGVLYMGILAIGTGRTLGRINPVKNALSLVVNLSAAIVYLVAHVLWGAEIMWVGVLVVAIGALVGGWFGAHVAKRLPDPVLRGIIVVVAIAALARQFWG